MYSKLIIACAIASMTVIGACSKKTTANNANNAANGTSAQSESKGFFKKSKKSSRSSAIDTANIYVTGRHIVFNEPIRLENTTFTMDKSKNYMGEGCKGAGIDIANVLKKNPSVKAKINWHTDCKSTNDATLEEAKLDAFVAYVLTQGEIVGRVKSKYYGSKEPIVPCSTSNTEAENAKNKRVEVIFTK